MTLAQRPPPNLACHHRGLPPVSRLTRARFLRWSDSIGVHDEFARHALFRLSEAELTMYVSSVEMGGMDSRPEGKTRTR